MLDMSADFTYANEDKQKSNVKLNCKKIKK